MKGRFPTELTNSGCMGLLCLQAIPKTFTKLQRVLVISIHGKGAGRWITWGYIQGNRLFCLPQSLWHHYSFKPLFLESFTPTLWGILCFLLSVTPSCLFPFSKQITLLSSSQKLPGRNSISSIPHPTCPHPPLASPSRSVSHLSNLDQCLILVPLTSFLHKLSFS